MKILHLASWCNVWDFPEKSKQGGLGMYFSEKPHWNFWICHLTLRNSEENKLSPLKILQNCDTPLGNSKVKNQDPFHMSFS